MNLKQFRNLCIKAVTGNINEAEKAVLDKWLAESDEYAKEYEKIKTVWSFSSLEGIPEIPDIEGEWKTLSSRLELDRMDPKVKVSTANKIYTYIQSLFIPRLKPITAGAFAVLLLIVSILILNKETPIPQVKKIVTTVNKEQKQIHLSDGSSVLLNSGSSIEFLETFSNKLREVHLEGEAFFSINKDGRPFIVTTSNSKTTVLGTEFNIWARDGKTRIIVKEGKVNLTRINTNTKGVNLGKGQLSTVMENKEPTSPEDVNPNYLLGWMEGKLVFNHTPLNEITDELERFYNVKLNLENKNLNIYTLTGLFENTEIDSVLTMICLTLDLDYEKQESGYLIKSKSTVK
jgi:transmembrane sensor